MSIFTGTSTKDNITGTADADTFAMDQGGNDKVFGLEGADTFNFGSELTEKDKIDGGDGSDILTIDGNYTAGITFLDTSLISIETLVLGAGHNYTLEFTDANFSFVFIIDGSALAAGDDMFVVATADTDSEITMIGGGGDDTLKGGVGNDVFDLSLGGADKAVGGDGFNDYLMGAAFDAADQLIGGASTDSVTVEGNYAGGLTITKTMLDDIEVVFLQGAFDYDVTLRNKAVEESLQITATNVGTGHSVVVDAHAEKTGELHFIDSTGNDEATGGEGADTLDFRNGGNDTGYGGLGGDSFSFFGALTSADRIDGGDGDDAVSLNGDYSFGLTFNPNTLNSVEAITMLFGHSYTLTMDDAMVVAGGTMTVFGSSLQAADVLTFDASAETDGRYSINGGAGNDIIQTGEGDDVILGNGGADQLKGADGADALTGGAGDDLLIGNLGTDALNGGAGIDRLEGGFGADTFVYTGVESDSSGVARDTVVSFNANVDKFDMAVGAIVDPQINAGTLSTATFDADIAAAVGALGFSHAVIFVPNAGDLAGRTFLIVERGAGVGYQVNHDYVIELETPSNLGAFSNANFI